MLNKRIKSVLVAGLLILGMSGNAFALEQNFYKGNDKGQCECSIDNKLENPSTGEHILDGVIKITISEDGKYAKIEPLKDENGYDLAKIHAVHMKGGPNYYCYKLNAEESWVDNLSCPLNGGGKIPEISHISVDYEVVPESERPAPEDKDKDGIPDHKDDEVIIPETPEGPNSGTTEPPTGDAGIMSIVAVATVSAAGLFVLRKKDDEE